jgi:DNA-binding response OmpR family regulator
MTDPQRAIRVALIDDHGDSREVIADFLRLSGFEVDEFASADLALPHLRLSAPDIVVTDLALPGMSGVELARELHSSGLGRTFPTVALTGRPNLSDAEAGLFARILVKPFEPLQLAATLLELVDAPR